MLDGGRLTAPRRNKPGGKGVPEVMEARPCARSVHSKTTGNTTKRVTSVACGQGLSPRANKEVLAGWTML
jgi:hypothetical protein